MKLRTLLFIAALLPIAAHAAKPDPWKGWVWACHNNRCPYPMPEGRWISLNEGFLYEECVYTNGMVLEWPSNCRVIPGQDKRRARRLAKKFNKVAYP